MKRLSILVVAISCIAAAACSALTGFSTGTDSPVSASQVQTACGWVQTADVVFKAVAPIAKIPQSVIDDEAKADQSVTTLCTPPYPTDLATTLADLLKIVQQIQTDTPATAAASPS